MPEFLYGIGPIVGAHKQLSQEQREALQRQFDAISTPLDSACKAVVSGDKDAESLQLSALSAALEKITYSPSNGIVSPFGLGLFVASRVQGFFIDNGRSIGTIEPVIEHMIATLGSNEALPGGICEGLRLQALQNDYKLDKWLDGAKVVADARKRGITSSLFVREVAGFAAGMIKSGHFTNEGFKLYVDLLSDKGVSEIPDISYGGAILNLSYLYGTFDRPRDQLLVLNSISNKDPKYYATNIATIAYWQFDAYQKLGDTSNQVERLIASAKNYKLHSDFVTDDVIRRDLPKLVKEYQDHGYIDDDLSVPVYKTATMAGRNTGRLQKVTVLSVMALITIASVYLMVRIQRGAGKVASGSP